MSSFTRALVTSPTGRTIFGRAELRVLEAFSFDIGNLGSGWTVTVPEGFVCDGLSAPWWTLPFLDVGTMQRAAVLHDYMLTRTDVSKPICDAAFYEAMIAEGTPSHQRELAYLAVRLRK